MAVRDPQDWTLGRAWADDKMVIIRALARVPGEDFRRTHATLIRVTWPCLGTASGMPDAATLDQMGVFEDAIAESIADANWAVEAAAVTGNGEKEWLYYCADWEDFVSRFSAALDAHPVYPVTLEGFPDPQWDALTVLMPT